MNERMPGGRSPGAAAALVFLVAIVSALCFAWHFPLPPVENDAADYLAIAKNVAAGNGFADVGGSPAVYRPPVFSALLGGWFLLTGNASPFSAAVFQSLMHGTGVLAAFLLFLALASPPWAFAGALCLAVHPLLVTRVAFVLQEPTILLFTTLAIWLSVRFLSAPSLGRSALAGAAWGLCTLTKVVACFGPLLLLAIGWLSGTRRRTGRGAEAAVFLLCCTAVVAPWTIRNYVHFGRFILVNDQGGGMLQWSVSHAEIPGQRPGAEVVSEMSRRNLTAEETRRTLWTYVLEHPAYFFGTRVVANAIRFTNPPRSWWWQRGMYGPGVPRPWYWTAYDLLHRLLFLALLIRAFRLLSGRQSSAGGFVVLFACAYWALHALAWGDGRFALPILPLLAAAPMPWKGSR